MNKARKLRTAQLAFLPYSFVHLYHSAEVNFMWISLLIVHAPSTDTS